MKVLNQFKILNYKYFYLTISFNIKPIFDVNVLNALKKAFEFYNSGKLNNLRIQINTLNRIA